MYKKKGKKPKENKRKQMKNRRNIPDGSEKKRKTERKLTTTKLDRLSVGILTYIPFKILDDTG